MVSKWHRKTASLNLESESGLIPKIVRVSVTTYWAPIIRHRLTKKATFNVNNHPAESLLFLLTNEEN